MSFPNTDSVCKPQLLSLTPSIPNCCWQAISTSHLLIIPYSLSRWLLSTFPERVWEWEVWIWLEPLAAASTHSVSKRAHTSDCVKMRKSGKTESTPTASHPPPLLPSILSPPADTEFSLQSVLPPSSPLPSSSGVCGWMWGYKCSICGLWSSHLSVSIATPKKSLAGMGTLRLRGAVAPWPWSKPSDAGWL